MTHLTDLEFVDAAEHVIDGRRPAVQPHLDSCAACRARVDELCDTLMHAASAEVPEPSPLFWDHLSARVREGIDGADPTPSWSVFGWLHRGSAPWAAFAALVVALMVGAVWRVNAPSPRLQPAVVDRAEEWRRTHPAPDPTERADSDDPAWAVVRTVSDGIAWDEATAAGIGARPGAAETAARSLTPEERSELVRLLLAEAKRPGA